MPDARFDYVHLDIVGPMSPSRGYRYCLTLIDRFSRWLEAVPIVDITSRTIIKAFFELGTKRIRATAYHPESNGLIERWHQTLKSALMCQATNEWADTLPVVLLKLRTSFKEDISASSAEMLFGKTLRLPREFFLEDELPNDPRFFVEPLCEMLRKIRPVPTAHHPNTNAKPFLLDIYSCKHVFLIEDTTRRPLDPPYSGLHRVVQRIIDHVFKINVDGRDITVSINRLKPAMSTPTSTATSQPPVSMTPASQPPYAASQPSISSSQQTTNPVRPSSTFLSVILPSLRVYEVPATHSVQCPVKRSILCNASISSHINGSFII